MTNYNKRFGVSSSNKRITKEEKLEMYEQKLRRSNISTVERARKLSDYKEKNKIGEYNPKKKKRNYFQSFK